MPDYRLSRDEADDLAAYLRSAAPGKLDRKAQLRDGNSRRGEDLFREVGCANCHSGEARASVTTRAAPAVFRTAASAGCLAPIRDRRTGAPTYALSDEDREALGEFLTTDGASLARRAPVEAAGRLVQSLRCAACHDRDAATSHWPAVLSEESIQGLPPEVVPALTWTGEKLRAAWLLKRMKGNLTYKPRPWLRARMPAWPAYADLLAGGLAAEHGLSTAAPKPLAVRKELATAGRQLTGAVGGLNCRQCHDVGNDRHTGDEQADFAPGINYAHVRDRIRHAFYRGMMLDPARYDPRSKMPQFTVDGKRTAVTDVFAGDAVRQFEAVWHYLHSLDTMPGLQRSGN